MPQSSSRKRTFLQWAYDRLWYRWPIMIVPLVRRFRRDHGYFPNLLRPRSLNEKVLYRMLFDRRAFLPTFAGKLESGWLSWLAISGPRWRSDFTVLWRSFNFGKVVRD